MRPQLRLITPSEALRRVFLPSLPDASTRTYCSRPRPNRPPTPQQCLSPSLPSILPRQHPRFTSSSSSQKSNFKPFAPPPPTPAQFGSKRLHPDRRPRDDEISAYKVYLVQPDTRLSEPLYLSDVLARRALDEKGRFTQFVQEVSAAAADEERPYPVCKLYDKKAVREAEEARRKTARAMKRTGAGKSKQLDLSWTMSDNDLGHRMAKLREFLEKGWRVEIVFGSQRRSGWTKKREASEEEARGVLEKIRKAVGEVEGAQEREMQGAVGKEAVLIFVGKAKKLGG